MKSAMGFFSLSWRVFPKMLQFQIAVSIEVTKNHTRTRDLEDKRKLNRFKILKDKPKPLLFLVIYGDYINLFNKDSTLEPIMGVPTNPKVSAVVYISCFIGK